VVCDDEVLLRSALVEHLEGEGFRTVQAGNGEQCLEAVREHAPAVVVMDLKMPVMDGIEALRRLREGGNDVPVVVITAHGAVDSAVEATRLGASAYLSKPFDLRELTIAVTKALAEDKLKQEVHWLRDRRRSGYGEFIGSSNSLSDVFATLARLEKVDAPTVLITGESGTGKDVIARAIHARGPRRNQVFMEIDCASLPEPLIESELFGHERGAFTDARATKRGLFEVASGGVVFLDEIGEMPLATQARLLRALESRKFKRVGGVANIEMDVAVVAATNKDLREEVRKGTFREDLFFRLDVIPLRLPPLRDRKDDLPALISHFLDRFQRQFGREVQGVSGAAMQLLQQYDWPGNVRELRNVLERVILLGPEGPIQPGDLPSEIRFWRGSNPAARAKCPFVLPEDGVDLDGVEKGLIAQALDRTGGNQTAAARLLGITRYALRYRIEKHGLDGPGPSERRENA
jgi:two-component system response regulator AtoC